VQKTTKQGLADQIKAARRAGVPLVSLNTSDAAATIRVACEAINGDAAKVQWDFVSGLLGLRGKSDAEVATGPARVQRSSPRTATLKEQPIARGKIYAICLRHRLPSIGLRLSTL
jgi:ABC-type sugar transport system substrate-binding protein